MQPGAFFRRIRGLGRNLACAGGLGAFEFPLRALGFADRAGVCLGGGPLLLALPLLGEPRLVLHLREESTSPGHTWAPFV